MRRSPMIAAAALLALSPRASRADEPGSLEAQVEKKAPAIVSLKYVLKAEGGGGGESNGEAVGAMADPSGLVVLSNDHFSGSPQQLKVLFGNDPAEHEAVLVAKDTKLGLAWVQVLDLGDKPVPAVDLSKPADVKVGLALFGVSRSGRGFDYAPSVERLYVSAKIEKPRAMWAVAGEFGEAGLPVFDLLGNAVGVLSDQGGSDAVSDEESSASKTCLLPLDVVAKSLALAKKRVPDAVAKAKEAKEAKEAAPAMDEGAMDGSKPPDLKPPEPKPPEKPPPSPEAPKPPQPPGGPK